MSAFVAKVRDIDLRHGVVGEETDERARGRLAQRLTELQGRDRAVVAARVNGGLIAHVSP